MRNKIGRYINCLSNSFNVTNKTNCIKFIWPNTCQYLILKLDGKKLDAITETVFLRITLDAMAWAYPGAGRWQRPPWKSRRTCKGWTH